MPQNVGLARHVVLAGLLGAAACGGSEGPQGGAPPGAEPPSREAESASARPIAGCLDVDGPAVPPPEAVAATPAQQQRYEQLRVETLRLMIDAARLSLPIGPCQTRIDRAVWAASQGDVPSAADIVADVAAGLQEAIAAAQR